MAVITKYYKPVIQVKRCLFPDDVNTFLLSIDPEDFISVTQSHDCSYLVTYREYIPAEVSE